MKVGVTLYVFVITFTCIIALVCVVCTRFHSPRNIFMHPVVFIVKGVGYLRVNRGMIDWIEKNERLRCGI